MTRTILIGLAGIASIVIPLFTKESPTLTLIALAVLSITLLSLLWSKANILRYLAAFILIPLVFDIPAVHAGLWTFANASVLGFPLWLPFLYGNASVCIGYFRKVLS